MPQVGNKRFAYNAAGIRAAMKAVKKQRQSSGRPLPRPRPGTMRPNFPSFDKFRPRPLPRPPRPGRPGMGDRPPAGPAPGPKPRRPMNLGGIRDKVGRPGMRQENVLREQVSINPALDTGRRPRPIRRPRPTSSMSSPQGGMNGIEALAQLSQQFGGGQGLNIGGGGPVASQPVGKPNIVSDRVYRPGDGPKVPAGPTDKMYRPSDGPKVMPGNRRVPQPRPTRQQRPSINRVLRFPRN